MRSLLGWIILSVALAVPALLFWNWWSKMKAKTRSEAWQPATQGGFAAPAGAPQTVLSPGATAQAAAPASLAASTGAVSAASKPAGAETLLAAKPPAPKPQPAREGEVRYQPATERDPTLSQEDYERLKPEPEPEPEPVVVKAPPPRRTCRDRVRLQGIIATPNGITALVNDQVAKEGEVVAGALVLRITTRVVYFRCKNEKESFSLRINK